MSDNTLQLGEEISEADWAQTPESVKRLVRSLLGRIEQLERQYEELKAENALLREQVKQNRQNSSKPPSQDIQKGFKPKEKQTKKQGKQRGAQFGHEGHEGHLYPVEVCKQVTRHYPERCLECGAVLRGEDPAPYRVQQVEIPQIVPLVQEHQFHALQCDCCGSETRAWDDAIINSSRSGERLVAHVSLLSGQYRQSHRMVQDLLQEVFGIVLSTGSIHQLRRESSVAIAPAVTEAQHYVQQQAQVNMDETSFAQGNYDGENAKGKQGWLWVMVTPWVSYFAVCLSRAGAVTRRHLYGHCQQRPL
jgi:transposase